MNKKIFEELHMLDMKFNSIHSQPWNVLNTPSTVLPSAGHYKFRNRVAHGKMAFGHKMQLTSSKMANPRVRLAVKYNLLFPKRKRLPFEVAFASVANCI